MTDQKPTDQPAESTGFWSVFHSLPFDRKNRFFKPYGKLLRIGSNTGNVFAPCPGYVAVVKLTGYTPTTGHFFLKGNILSPVDAIFILRAVLRFILFCEGHLEF